MTIIGFLGPEGTFSHEAAMKYRGNSTDVTLMAYPSISELTMAVDRGEINEAVLPIENSLEGGVIPTLDILMEAQSVRIKGELNLPICENLLVKKGHGMENIKLIVSHSQPLGQCRKYLRDHFSGAAIESVGSTAVAAGMVRDGDGSIAAIGGNAAAELYCLEILQSNIHDQGNNTTRFIIIGTDETENADKCKTSIIFAVGHIPGSLYKVLGILDMWDINMTRIESRPSKGKLGEYVFYVDILGHRKQKDISDALEMIKRKTTFYKFLGSYVAYDEA